MARLFFLAGILFCSGIQARHFSIDLQKALDKKLVEAKAVSLGGHEGYCIAITLKNKAKDSLLVLIEAGRRLNSIEEKNQDILITKEQIIALRAGEIKSVNVKGYCCQLSNSSPAKGAKYDINKMADLNLVFVARYLNTNAFGADAEQAAVWSISDKRPTATIFSQHDSLLQPLREMVATIKGEELPWYGLISRKHVLRDGTISVVPLRLKGSMIYSNEKENYATLFVKDEKGSLVCEIKSEWLKACSGQEYQLDLPVKGLAKGKYSIELKTPDKQLATREFEL